MLALRTRKGLNISSFQSEKDKEWLDRFMDKVRRLENEGFLVQQGDFVSATKKGLPLLDRLIVTLI